MEWNLNSVAISDQINKERTPQSVEIYGKEKTLLN